jgi:hypothetical protein
VLEHLLRIGDHAIVSFPNFGHWRMRLGLLVKGRMPVTKKLPYTWYDTPNIHFCTIRDFVNLCDEIGAKVERAVAIDGNGQKIGFRCRGGSGIFRRAGGVFVEAVSRHAALASFRCSFARVAFTLASRSTGFSFLLAILGQMQFAREKLCRLELAAEIDDCRLGKLIFEHREHFLTH